MARPRIIESPEEFERLAQAYFDACDESGKPYLVTGLVRALGFSSRQSLLEYEKRPEFLDTVKAARLRVEEQREEDLLTNPKPTGTIFWLKNHGWSDRREVEHSGAVETPGLQVIVKRADDDGE